MIRQLGPREEVLRGFWPSEGAPISTPSPPAPASVDAAVAIVRTSGFRASSARRLVLEALFAADAPVTAGQIAGGLDGRTPRSDLGSVYRNLETLERLGVVRHVHAAHGPALYALARDEDEGFLACERCGEVRSGNPHAVAVIRGAVRKAFGYDASFLHFPIVGVCPRCAAEEEGS
jgi:Fur family ferric uptake transcriptional regulator